MNFLKELWMKILAFFLPKPVDHRSEIAKPVENPTTPHVPIETVPEPPKSLPITDRAAAINKLALEITGSFEGKGFTQISGDFDGQGVSAGILQWNFGQGSLQEKILRPYLEKFGSIDALGIFPQPMDVAAHMSTSQGVAYARTHMVDASKGGNPMKLQWRAAWEKFLGRLDVISLQVDAANGVLAKARKLAQDWGYPESPRAICFFFDIVTQNGSMSTVSKPAANRNECLSYLANAGSNKGIWGRAIEGASDEMLVLFQAAYLRARKSNPQWFSDVFSRKGTIALGVGTVHGTPLELNSRFAVIPKL